MIHYEYCTDAAHGVEWNATLNAYRPVGAWHVGPQGLTLCPLALKYNKKGS
jgi:hypothetical protein